MIPTYLVSLSFSTFSSITFEKPASTPPPASLPAAGQVSRQISAAELTQIASRFIHTTTLAAAAMEKHTIKIHYSAAKAATLLLFATE